MELPTPGLFGLGFFLCIKEKHDELVANTVMALASDEKAFAKAIGIEENKSLFNKVKEAIKNIVARIKEWFKNVDENGVVSGHNMQAQPWLGDVQALEQLAQKFNELTTAAKQNKAEFGERESEERFAKGKKVKRIYGIPGNKTFLPYDKGYSEANERATRWAHRSDVKVGDWKLVSYHQRWYTIEKFDDSELKYQVTKHVKAKELQLYINKWEEQYGQSFSESMGEFHNEIDDINRETTQYGKRGSNSNVDVFEYAQEDNTVRRLDENKNNQRQTTVVARRSNARSDIDSQRKSLRLDSAYLSAVERGDMETAQKMVDEAAKAATRWEYCPKF